MLWGRLVLAPGLFTLEPTDGTFTLARAPRHPGEQGTGADWGVPRFQGELGGRDPPRGSLGLSLPNISQHNHCQGCGSGCDVGSRRW